MANLNTITDPVFLASPAFGISSTNITNWNTAFGWGNHATAGYATASNTMTFTNKTGNISQWTNNVGYLTSVPTLQAVTAAGNTSTLGISLSGNATFAANGTPAVGKIPIGTDASGNWTWQVLTAPTQTSGSWTPTGTHITPSGVNDYLRTGKLVTLIANFNVAVNADATIMSITGLPTLGIGFGTATITPQSTGIAITGPIIGSVDIGGTPFLYFTPNSGISSVYTWQDFSGASLQVMITYMEL